MLTKEYQKMNEALTRASYVHWLADPDKSGQAVHSGSFAPALASLIFNSLCRSTTANAPANRQMPIASVISSKQKNVIS